MNPLTEGVLIDWLAGATGQSRGAVEWPELPFRTRPGSAIDHPLTAPIMMPLAKCF